MHQIFRPFGSAIHTLRQTPAFALTAILTLALGIGLATAVFTVADALLLRRLPYPAQDQLVVLSGASRDGSVDHYPLGYDDASEFSRQSWSFRGAALYAYWGASPTPVREGDGVSRLRRALVSGSFFEVLGVKPEIGRTIRPEDDVAGTAPVAVLSHGAWLRRYGGDPTVLGTRLVTFEDSVAYTIVGVMPQGIDFPSTVDFWAPVVASTPPARMEYVAFYVLGRLDPGATEASARAELTRFFGRPETSPWLHDFQGESQSLPRLLIGDIKPALLVFAAAAGLLLLITGVNVATLLLVRGMGRVREMAVRTALGASRVRVIGQLLAENATLALAGGGFGVVVAAVAVKVFVGVAPGDVPRLDEIGLNTTALLGALGITGVAMLLFGLAPAVLTSRVQSMLVLRSGTALQPLRNSRRGIEALVAGQVAIAFLVLSAAGLLGRSLIRLERAELAFDPSHLLIGQLAVRSDLYDDPAKQTRLLETLLPELTALPGVGAASPLVAVPFSGSRGWDGRFAAEGQSEAQAAANPLLNMELVTPDYFATLGVPILRGRAFTPADREGAPEVIVLSQSATRHYWPDADPIGQRLMAGAELEHVLTVVGVVPDTRYRSLREARPSVYFPLAQSFFPFAPMTLAIRTVGSPDGVVPTIRRTIAEAAPGVALESAAPFETYLAEPLAQPRLTTMLLTLFAGAAVTLAAVGLFAIMMTMVRQRTRELGIRMALGATGQAVSWMVMRRGLRIASVGLGAGLLGSLATHRLMASILFGVSPTDGLTLAIVAGGLLLLAGLAGVIPARSSARVDPVVALRADG